MVPFDRTPVFFLSLRRKISMMIQHIIKNTGIDYR